MRNSQQRSATLMFLAMGLLASPQILAKDPHAVLTLWPSGQTPGPTRVKADEGEQLVTSRRRTFKQYTNISVPQLAVFLAPEEVRTGASVLVCPGGGMQRLAYEHEGLEIADWLNPLGISVFVLKYRVPGPSSTALLDAQRAMGLIRQRADEYSIDPDRIGAMGFSAGGELVLLLATNYQERGYEAIDEADAFSCRPANVCLVYPGGIVSRRVGGLRTDIADKLDPELTPEMFIVHAFSDASTNSLALALELKRKRIPCEMHIYQEGGHGFGARESALPLSGWKASYVQWIDAKGFFDVPPVAAYANELIDQLRADTPLKTLTDYYPQATLADAFAVQRRVCRAFSSADRIVGFKSGAVIPDPFNADGPEGPATAPLFESGKLPVDGPLALKSDELGAVMIETELGFVVSRGLDISTRISTVEQIKGAFESVVKVIEMPVNLSARVEGPMSPTDQIATNIGSNRVYVASSGVSPDDFDPRSFRLSLRKGTKELHGVQGDPVEAGIWHRLIVVVNRIVDQGYTLHSGDLVISGALGGIHAVDKGDYVADYGDLGKIEFAIE